MKDNKFKIYVMKDDNEQHHIKKDIIFDVPLRLLVTGKSQISGKSNLVGNLLCLPEYYFKQWNPENMFIFTPNAYIDDKWVKIIKYNEIPSSNVFTSYSEESLKVIYELINEKYEEAKAKKEAPEHWLIVFDDLGSSSQLHNKKNKMLNELVNNGRHLLVSIIACIQYYKQANPNFRSNVTGVCAFGCTENQLEAITQEHNTITTKKNFMKAFNEVTKEKHNFFTVNYTNPPEKRYLKNFEDVVTFN